MFNQAAIAANDMNNPQRLIHAYHLFCSACSHDETWWESFFQTGNVNSDMNYLHAAVACWRRALECEMTQEQRAKVLTNMAWRLHSVGLTGEALRYAEEAKKLDIKLPYLWVNLACIYQILDRGDDAEQAGATAFALDPKDPLVETGYAFNLLFNRKLQQGIKHFEARFQYKLKNFLQYPYPKWEGEPDKTVYLVADQGLGDTLSYARFVPAACKRAKYVHAYVQPELLRLFQYSFAGIDNLNVIPAGGQFPPADCWSTFVSLPFALGLTDEQYRNQPHIAYPTFQMPFNWKLPDRKLHVGIAWAGSPLNDIDRFRNIPATMFLELCRVKGIQLYSLQVGERNADMHNSGMAPVVRDLTPWIREVTDTLAILRELDLVITCESALGHICTLAQKECWVPYSWLGRDYRIGLTGEDQIWSNYRIFRQGPDRDWFPVFMKIAEALEERVDAIDRAAAARSEAAE